MEWWTEDLHSYINIQERKAFLFLPDLNLFGCVSAMIIFMLIFISEVFVASSHGKLFVIFVYLFFLNLENDKTGTNDINEHAYTGWEKQDQL